VTDPVVRPDGPWDEADYEAPEGEQRLDLGALRVAQVQGIDVQVQADENTGQVVLLTFARPDGAVQVQPFAAPRSGGLWESVRGQIKSSINTGGGLVEEAQGPFGVELRAQVRATDGSTSMQPARFVGIDGPRWFLRAVFLGAASKPGPTATSLEAMVRSLVVVRGTEAMPVGVPIPLRMPSEGGAQAAADAPPTLSPFARGPEITETR
jgi:hypothetical protein